MFIANPIPRNTLSNSNAHWTPRSDKCNKIHKNRFFNIYGQARISLLVQVLAYQKHERWNFSN